MKAQATRGAVIAASFAMLAAGCGSNESAGPESWSVFLLGQVTTAGGAPVTQSTEFATWYRDACGGDLIDAEVARPDGAGRYQLALDGEELEGCIRLQVIPDAELGLAEAAHEV